MVVIIILCLVALIAGSVFGIFFSGEDSGTGMSMPTIVQEINQEYLSDEEYSRVIQSLVRLKNSLIFQGRYTDGVDDVLCKVLSAKKRKLKIKYI